MKRAVLRAAAALGAMLVVLLLAGWSTHGSWAPGLLVTAPSPAGEPAARPHDVRRTVEVARAGAHVRAWVFEPAGAPRGTVLLLHGIRDHKQRLVASARKHAARGFRSVAVDARGHGESTGQWLTYGVEEARDVVGLVEALERDALLVRPLSVLGTSYGAATALQYAAIDRRVDKVVALAPFASLRQVVPAYLAWVLGSLAHCVPSSLVDRLIDDSARKAGFDADDACPRCVAPRITADVLLVHSRDDERIPWRHSVEIHEALRSRKRLLLVSGVGHVAIGRGAGVEPAIHDWLDR